MTARRQSLASWLGAFRDRSFDEKRSFFRQVFLFRQLNDRALALLVRTMMERKYADGDLIFSEGDVGRACFIVGEGKVRLTRLNKSTGVEETLADMGPGDFFGEMVLLDELPRGATARAAEPTTLFIFYKSNFDSLVSDAPKVAASVLHALARLLSARLRRENYQPAQQPVQSL